MNDALKTDVTFFNPVTWRDLTLKYHKPRRLSTRALQTFLNLFRNSIAIGFLNKKRFSPINNKYQLTSIIQVDKLTIEIMSSEIVACLFW